MSTSLDRAGFEALCDRHESSVFNFCLRTAGSRGVAATATRAAFLGACRKREAHAVDLLAAARRESANLVGLPRDYRAAATSPPQVREANARLGLRHREVLALRELVGCSYGEIARVIGADRETVAGLLWRARLELRDELKGSRLASIAPLATPCKRALALMVMNCDGELRDTDDRNWLQRHLRTCGKCRLSQEAAREASACYRAWPPAAPPTGLRESLMAAAEGVFATDSPERPAAGCETSSRRPAGSPPPGAPRGAPRSPA